MKEVPPKRICGWLKLTIFALLVGMEEPIFSALKRADVSRAGSTERLACSMPVSSSFQKAGRFTPK